MLYDLQYIIVLQYYALYSYIILVCYTYHTIAYIIVKRHGWTAGRAQQLRLLDAADELRALALGAPRWKPESHC